MKQPKLGGMQIFQVIAPIFTEKLRTARPVNVLKNWKTRQLDIVLAYTQAKVERDLYMQIPTGYSKPGITSKTHALQLIKNLYGQKQAGRVWNKYMTERTIALGFKQSEADECVFYFKRSVLLVYTDDCIMMGPCDKELDKMLKKPKSAFDLTEEGDLCDYLGIKVTR